MKELKEVGIVFQENPFNVIEESLKEIKPIKNFQNVLNSSKIG